MTTINLPEVSGRNEWTECTLVLEERLPEHLLAPCTLKTQFKIDAIDDYYLLHINTQGILSPICQRCMHSFNFTFDNHLTLAVTDDDERADSLMRDYEVICSQRGVIDLNHVLTDELHFSVPLFHPDAIGCTNEYENE